MELHLGAFVYERETKNTLVYSRVNERGQRETQYVQKAVLRGYVPTEIEVVLHCADR